jgi:MFS family permease
MDRYLRLLQRPPFAALWFGSTVSSLGDALTWVALAWLVFDRTGSARALSLLVVVATAPVIVGGPLMGAVLDRFDRRHVLVTVNGILCLAVASVPTAAATGRLTTAQLYAVAATYGLLKMANWAGVPSMLPEVVAEDELDTANAMESIGFGVADVGGPALGGALIGLAGAPAVLAVDAASYLVFVVALVSLPAEVGGERSGAPIRGLGLVPAIRTLASIRPVLGTTLMFMAANAGEGALLVLIPVYVRDVLHGGPATFGLLLSTFAFAVLAGSLMTGAIRWTHPLGRSIAGMQTAAGIAYAPFLFEPNLGIAVATMALAGSLTSPLTIWAQSLRMRLIPDDIRGRSFGVLRTVMQSTPPLGGALAGVGIAAIGVRPLFAMVVLLIGVPGIWGLKCVWLAPANETERLAAV